jgi:hypothetical protein
MDGKKIALISLGAIALGVGGYFGYKAIKKAITGTQDDGLDTPKPILSGGTPSSGGGGGSSNPFSTKAQLKAFQQWVINVKKDKTILGSGGDSGFGDDGLWGSKSAKAWAKYGNEYKNSQSGITPTPSGSGSTTSSSGWSSSDFSAQNELKNIIESFGWDTEDNPSSNSFEWDVAGGWKFPTSYMKFYVSDSGTGIMTIEKKKNYLSDRYAKISGSWKKTSNGWEFNIGGKKYTAPYTGSGLSDKLWAILKDNKFYSVSDGSFIEFDGIKLKRNKKQLDMRCEDLM